ncbi:hypothetical protein Pcinc_009001 [Petrolisthes cinctipes]|uniref:CUB domain-containing protein n=1 Tax=Petrolisthes cinctipes TaxID=88211 RepID=A0AAE1G5I7_PETCI|nr:hypothetical protein Pcinc_009001 [Petrolisthes cinctipes]
MWESKCGTTSTTCLNEGYTGENCSCVCPPNFSGDNCQNQIRESYYAPPTDGCTQRVTTEKNLFAPNMSADVSDGLQCAIEIIAPQGLKPRLTFNTFNLQPRTTCSEGDCCFDENLQFRENYPESSTAYCGTDISSGNEFTFDSQQVVIYYYRDSSVTTCGWSADITFVSDPNCIPTEGGCTLEFNNISTYNWKSPGFDGTTEYPICSTCTQDMTGMPNTMLYLTSESFNMGTPPVDGECTDDYIQINHLYGRSEKFCGSEPIYFTSPSSSFSLEFHSNYITPATGFDITMKMASYCAIDCHQAPEGKQIVIKKLVSKVKVNTECTSNFILVNGDGNRRYPMDTSIIICDYDTRIDHLTTNTNNLLVAYQKTDLDSKGFKMRLGLERRPADAIPRTRWSLTLGLALPIDVLPTALPSQLASLRPAADIHTTSSLKQRSCTLQAMHHHAPTQPLDIHTTNNAKPPSPTCNLTPPHHAPA